MREPIRLLLAAIIFCLSVSAVFGATRTWTGASINNPFPPKDNLWTNQFNWSGNVAPVAGDDLVFNGGIQATSINTFSAGTTFNSITINGHVMSGAAVALNAGVSGIGAQISLASITLNNDQTFTATTAGGGLTFTSPIVTNGRTLTLGGPGAFVLAGAISGNGGIIKNGSGPLQFGGNHSYTGNTTINDGPVRIGGDHSNSRFVSVDGPNALIGGAGTVKGLSASDPIDPGAANNGTGIIASAGNLDISTDGSLQIDIKGTTPGTQFDQLQVTGAVEIDNISGLFGAGLNIELVGFTPAPGDSFVIISNDGTDPITNGAGPSGAFFARPEGSSSIVPNSSGGNTIFFITYRGGDGNDVVLHVPTTRTWDGGGSDNKWSTPGNWVDDVAPQVGDALVFPDNALQKTNQNDFPARTTFTAITLSGGGYALNGNEVSLVTEFASVLPADTQGAGVNLVITGPAQFRHETSNNTGTVLNNANTYTGGTVIRRGPLRINGSQPDIPVTIERGTLAGNGSTGPVTITGASNFPTISPGDFSPTTIGILTTKSVSFNANGRLFISFGSGTTPGSSYDQLNVNGTVALNGAGLTLSRESALPPVGSVLLILKNDGTDAISGTFLNLPEGAAIDNPGAVPPQTGGRAVISYQGGDGNDVTLTFTSTPTPTPSPTPSASPTPTPGPTSTPGPTATPTPDPSATPTPTPDPSATPTPTPDPSATPTPTPNPPPTSLANISTRLFVETGDNVLIGGFIVTGNQPKKVIVRAIGTSLSFADKLANPTLELHGPNGLIEANDNWVDSPNRQEISDSTIPPSSDLEAAIVATLPANNAGYTAIVRGVNNSTGIGVVEAYDLDSSVDSKLANIATRGFVQTGDNVLIAGTIIVGEAAQRVLVRAIGPSLTLPGKLEDPILELRDANGGLVRGNDNWRTGGQEQEIINTTIPPPNDLESAIVATLPAGGASYTAIVRGVNDTTGIAVVEVYALQ